MNTLPLALAIFYFGVLCIFMATWLKYLEDKRAIDRSEELHKLMRKYVFNLTTQRFELTKEQIDALPYKTVTPKEHFLLLHEATYNPWHIYMNTTNLRKNEAGHDLKFRYIVK